MNEQATIRPTFAARYRNALLGGLAVVLFFAVWQAIFLFVPLNPLFISKPSLIAAGLVDLVTSGDLFHDLAVSAVPFFIGLAAAVIVAAGLAYLIADLTVGAIAPAGTPAPVPGHAYFVMMAAGLAGALAIIGAALPLLGRVTSAATVRFE